MLTPPLNTPSTFPATLCPNANSDCDPVIECSGGTYRTSPTECADCMPCGEEEYEIAPCTPTTNRLCDECAPCRFNQYMLQPCGVTTDTLCAELSPPCSQFQFELLPPTETSDRKCQRIQQCDPALRQVIDRPATATRDATCRTCEDGTYPLGNVTCVPCEPCSSGQFLVEECGTEDTLCQDCSPCNENFFASTPCNATHDATCSLCQQCTGSQYEAVPCTQSTDRDCLPLRVCRADEYESAAPTPTSNRDCEDITPCPAANRQVIDTPATAVSNAVCKTCGSEEFPLNAFTCFACKTCGADEYETVPCGPAVDRECAKCKPCSYGQYMAADCTATSNRVCVNATGCNSTIEYEVARPVDADIDCDLLTVCNSSSYETVAPTATSDRHCGLLTVCDADELAVVPPTSTTDRVCERPECDEGFYEVSRTSPSTLQCDPLSVCNDTSYERTPPTATTDRRCQRLTVCADDALVVANATATSDRVCGPAVSSSSDDTLASGAIAGVVVAGVAFLLIILLLLLGLVQGSSKMHSYKMDAPLPAEVDQDSNFWTREEFTVEVAPPQRAIPRGNARGSSHKRHTYMDLDDAETIRRTSRMHMNSTYSAMGDAESRMSGPAHYDVQQRHHQHQYQHPQQQYGEGAGVGDADGSYASYSQGPSRKESQLLATPEPDVLLVNQRTLDGRQWLAPRGLTAQQIAAHQQQQQQQQQQQPMQQQPMQHPQQQQQPNGAPRVASTHEPVQVNEDGVPLRGTLSSLPGPKRPSGTQLEYRRMSELFESDAAHAGEEPAAMQMQTLPESSGPSANASTSDVMNSTMRGGGDDGSPPSFTDTPLLPNMLAVEEDTSL